MNPWHFFFFQSILNPRKNREDSHWFDLRMKCKGIYFIGKLTKYFGLLKCLSEWHIPFWIDWWNSYLDFQVQSMAYEFLFFHKWLLFLCTFQKLLWDHSQLNFIKLFYNSDYSTLFFFPFRKDKLFFVDLIQLKSKLIMLWKISSLNL